MISACIRTRTAIIVLMGAIHGEPPLLTYEHGICQTIDWLINAENKPPYPVTYHRGKGVAVFCKQASVIEDLRYSAHEHIVLLGTQFPEKRFSEGVRNTINFLFDPQGTVKHPLDQ